MWRRLFQSHGAFLFVTPIIIGVYYDMKFSGMQKFVIALFLNLSVFSSHAFAQGSVEMDAIAFARDSGKTQVEIYYTVTQGAMSAEKKSDGWHLTINARAELWETGKVLAAQNIKKEKLIKGSFDSSKGDLILDGVALTANVKTGGEAVIIFLLKNDKGLDIADTSKRGFLSPASPIEKHFSSAIELQPTY